MVDEELEPLITRCPNCATQFRVTENQLAAAGGRVRCGACLTVFQGINHLILDEESAFATGSEADAALDALLDELGSEERAAPAEEESEEESQKEGLGGEEIPLAHEDELLLQAQPVEAFEPPRQIYGGFEDDSSDSEVSRLEDQLKAEAEEVSEAIHELEIIDKAAPDAEIVARDEDGLDAEAKAVADVDHEPVEDVDHELVEDADGGAVEDADSGAVEDADSGAVEDADSGAVEDSDWLKEDYEKWIVPGTANIDQLVDQVVASGRPVADEAGEIEPASVEEADAAEALVPKVAGDGFHLSAVEEALAEEGVGVRPITFAPEPRRWWVGGVAALLIVLLAGQIFYLQLPDWSRDPGLRETYERFCSLFGCELAEMRTVGALRTRNLVVRSHPELQGALIIDAVIVNQAGYAQRFPELELKFTSVGGLLVAGRIFTPAEYLSGEMGHTDLMPPSTPVQISLEIDDPGKDAVNYTLSFH